MYNLHSADAFFQSDFVHSGYTFFQCVCVCSLGIEPRTLALLTQCSTTDPQEHRRGSVYKWDHFNKLWLTEQVAL